MNTLYIDGTLWLNAIQVLGIVVGILAIFAVNKQRNNFIHHVELMANQIEERERQAIVLDEIIGKLEKIIEKSR